MRQTLMVSKHSANQLRTPQLLTLAGFPDIISAELQRFFLRPMPVETPLLSRKSIDANDRAAHHLAGLRPAPVESELKFYVPSELGQSLLLQSNKTDKEPPLFIEQHVLQPKKLQRLLREFGVGDEVSNTNVFTSARARRIVEAGSERFLIEFKSQKTIDQISRFEFGVSIAEARFKSLRNDDSIGCLRKLRYAISGTVTTDTGTMRTSIELDRVLDAGNPATPLSAPFFTADIEGSRAILDAVRQGRHSFDWLKECVMLSFADNRIRKPLTNKRLACQGFGAPQDMALKALLSL